MLEDYLYNIDNFSYVNNILDISGWIFNINKKINRLRVIIVSREEEHKIGISNIAQKRADVYEVYKNENSLYCGFSSKIKIENANNICIYIEIDGSDRILLKRIKDSFLKKIKFYKKKFTKKNLKKALMFVKNNKISELSEATNRIIVEKIEGTSQDIDFIKFKKENTIEKIEYPNELYNYIVDVIIPVYNGYEYLKTLFDTINKTKMNYRLIIINDKSSDSRVLELLRKNANENNKVILIENEENLGFVKTVNKALRISENNIALLNTDIELPNMWLERLMFPIILNKDVASSTPFTNCGTICSFPNFCEDNNVFENMNVDSIDSVFQTIKPLYTELPTGVGFCMGINKEALDKIGLLDADVFGKGYGEENDWCQRAIKAGYKNIQVENLYVYHKHGGSFLDEEKKKLLESNIASLSKKHPSYISDINNFCKLDPVKEIRNFIIFKILSVKNDGIIVYFNHNIGGGATSYLKGKIEKDIYNGDNVIVIRYDRFKKKYLFDYKYKEYNTSYNFESLDKIIGVLEQLKIKRIYINELVTYPNIYDILSKLSEFKLRYNTSIIMLLHDFFCICPAVNLINDKGCYCDIPSIDKCEQCIENNELNVSKDYESINEWRRNWGLFLNECDEIITFSNNSAMLLERSYNITSDIIVIPHVVDYIMPINNEHKSTGSLNIGLLGTLNYNKGLTIIEEMLNIIEELKLNINIILIGSTVRKIKHKNFRETGEYTTDMLAKLVIENDIDLFFISSIWPETFSYTTQEVIDMNIPVVSFNLGAQAEKIEKYSKGMVISDINAKDALESIINFNNSLVNKNIKK